MKSAQIGPPTSQRHALTAKCACMTIRVMSRLWLQVAMALFLPISFLWLTLACVATCEAQAETHSKSTILSAETATTELAGHASSCPLRALPVGTIPDKSNCKAKMDPAAALHSFSIVSAHQSRGGTVLTHSGASPPRQAAINELPVLRI